MYTIQKNFMETWLLCVDEITDAISVLYSEQKSFAIWRQRRKVVLFYTIHAFVTVGGSLRSHYGLNQGLAAEQQYIIATSASYWQLQPNGTMLQATKRSLPGENTPYILRAINDWRFATVSSEWFQLGFKAWRHQVISDTNDCCCCRMGVPVGWSHKCHCQEVNRQMMFAFELIWDVGVSSADTFCSGDVNNWHVHRKLNQRERQSQSSVCLSKHSFIAPYIEFLRRK